MEFAARRRRRERENVVPLINVVFLLLVFFLLSGTLRPGGPFDVDPPRSESAAAPSPAIARELWLDAGGRLAVDGRTITPDALAAELADAPETEVRLRADADARADVLLPLLSRLHDAGVNEVELVTRPASP